MANREVWFSSMVVQHDRLFLEPRNKSYQDTDATGGLETGALVRAPGERGSSHER